jgi:hypothetical protein
MSDASKYLAAGMPNFCFLSACRKPFESVCTRGDDGHYYCSQGCADAGRKVDLRQLELLPRPKQVSNFRRRDVARMMQKNE